VIEKRLTNYVQKLVFCSNAFHPKLSFKTT
jgi:hypothetical protein